MLTTSINTAKNIRQMIPYCLAETHFTFGKKYPGKVRDVYDCGDQLIIVTTDRLSAFDRSLALIPYKGQVLNLVSAWWFEQTRSIVENPLLAIPDVNVMVVKKCRVFPIEFVVRGYITGSTETALWTQYQKGVRHYCGLSFPEGLKKNERLAQPVLTPTTKETKHDRPIAPSDIIAEGWMTKAEWEEASEIALRLFQLGTEIAKKQGLILVDTKYELGRDASGRLVLLDEVHTPDSSRYWLSHTYLERMQKGEEPDSIDKEFLRLWFKAHCDPYHDETLPAAPEELVVTLAERYIQLYQMITGQSFVYAEHMGPIEERILLNLERTKCM